jgi:hypothetical protein
MSCELQGVLDQGPIDVWRKLYEVGYGVGSESVNISHASYPGKLCLEYGRLPYYQVARDSEKGNVQQLF